MAQRSDRRFRARRVGVALALLALFATGSGCSRSSTSDPAPIVTASESDVKGAARTSLDSPAPTAAQLERRRKFTEAVAALGLPTLPALPVVEDETTVRPRAANEIADRCVATAICAMKGETKDQKAVDALTATFGAAPHFSPEEARFVHDPAPAADQLPKFGWRYECVHVFLWSLGYLPELAPPNRTADVPKEMAILRDKGPKAFLADAKPRPMREVLDMADFYYRLHWATTELALKDQRSEAANDEIVIERHRALNWLIRYMNQEWDAVTTDT